MICADTSFLCAVYLPQSTSEQAARVVAKLREPILLPEILACEFRQTVRFQVWRNQQNRLQGVSLLHADVALNAFEADTRSDLFRLASPSIQDVLTQAETISRSHTISGGHRSFDILHVATALVLQAKVFLTFDAKQRELAKAEGLRVAP